MAMSKSKRTKKKLKPSSAIDLEEGQKDNIREWLKQSQKEKKLAKKKLQQGGMDGMKSVREEPSQKKVLIQPAQPFALGDDPLEEIRRKRRFERKLQSVKTITAPKVFNFGFREPCPPELRDLVIKHQVHDCLLLSSNKEERKELEEEMRSNVKLTMQR